MNTSSFIQRFVFTVIATHMEPESNIVVMFEHVLAVDKLDAQRKVYALLNGKWHITDVTEIRSEF